MKERGYSSSSYYRINSVVDKNERLMVTKFVRRDVEPLDRLSGDKVYLLHVKPNREERTSCGEKSWLAEAVNTNTYFHTAVPLTDYRLDSFDALKKCPANQHGHWAKYYTPDHIGPRAYLYGCVSQTIEIPKH